MISAFDHIYMEKARHKFLIIIFLIIIYFLIIIKTSEVFCFIYEISFPIQVETYARKKRIIS